MSDFIIILVQALTLILCIEIILDFKIKYNWICALGIAIIAHPIFLIDQLWGAIAVAGLFIGLLKWHKIILLKAVAAPLIAMVTCLSSMVLLEQIVKWCHLIPSINQTNGLTVQLFNLVACLFGYAILYVIRKLLSVSKLIHTATFEGVYAKLGIGITALGFIIIYYFTINDPFEKDEEVLSTIFLTFLILLFMGVLALLALGAMNYSQRKQKEIELEQLKNYTERLEVLYKDIRVFKHDYVNILASIMGYVENADMAGLERHVKDIVVPYSKKLVGENESLGALTNIKVTPLKGIMTTKIIDIYKYNLNHSIEVVEAIERIDIDILDLCRMVGILMDNAIEAAWDSHDKIIDVALINGNECVSIIVSNSMPIDMMPIHKMYQEGVSSKGLNRGIGLNNYKTLAQKYNNVLIETEIDNNHFRQILRVSHIC